MYLWLLTKENENLTTKNYMILSMEMRFIFTKMFYDNTAFF